MKIFALAASSRQGSLNQTLLAFAASRLQALGATVEKATYRDFDVPAYDGDTEATTGHPDGALALRDRLVAADGWLLATPEYNFSMPGSLKNLIDWTSRLRPQPFSGKYTLLLSASPSLVGGNRGLWHTRVPLEALGALVHGDMFSLASAHAAFDDAGQLKDTALAARLDLLLTTYLENLRRLRG